MSKETSKERILSLLDEGWKLFGTPHMRSPKGYIIQVHRTTFKKMVKDGSIIVNGKTHEYIKAK